MTVGCRQALAGPARAHGMAESYGTHRNSLRGRIATHLRRGSPSSSGAPAGGCGWLLVAWASRSSFAGPSGAHQDRVRRSHRILGDLLANGGSKPHDLRMITLLKKFTIATLLSVSAFSAASTLTGIPAAHATSCRHGWSLMSRGSGTCSWHGGIKRTPWYAPYSRGSRSYGGGTALGPAATGVRLRVPLVQLALLVQALIAAHACPSSPSCQRSGRS